MENEFTYCQKCGEKNPSVNSNCQKCSELLDSGILQSPTVQAHYVQPQYIPPYQPQPVRKKKQSGCLIALAVFVGIIVFFGVISAIIVGNNASTTNTNGNRVTTQKNEDATTKPLRVPTVLSVDKLIDDLDDNALNASEKYKNQYVELTGRVSTIDSSGDYFSLGILSDEFSLDTVLCNIKREHLDMVRDFKTGQKVTVVGTITNVGEIMGYILDVESIK